MSNCYSVSYFLQIKIERIRYSNDTFMKMLPAMCDRRACIWCIHRNNSSKELEEWSWMFWYAMIGPSCILKLFYLSTIRVSHLFLLKKIQNNSKLCIKICQHLLSDVFTETYEYLLLLIMQSIRMKIHIDTKHLNCVSI